jgi:hypothetical protein
MDRVAKLSHKFDQLIEAAMHVADNVERPVLRLLVVPQRLTFDRDGIDLFSA